jgi:hypothetical protein
MKSSVDCPNIQGWVALRVYGNTSTSSTTPGENTVSNERKEENNPVEEIFEFTKCFLCIEVCFMF